jgi:acetolactate synthase regulatory subunit
LKSLQLWREQITNLPITKLQIAIILVRKKEAHMQVFHIRYRNAQGALMRILNAVSRRGLDLTSVHAEYAGQDHAVTLLLQVSHKQIGQLSREWHSIVDVMEVHSSSAIREQGQAAWAPHPPATAGGAEPMVRAALA